jgi:hypothetical protein
MYREFIYLDTDRIQSIIAQLQEGLLTEIMSGKQKELSGKAGIAKGVLAQFLPFDAEAQGKYGTDIKHSKVLHDYAFNLTLDSLTEKDLLIDNVDKFSREEFPVPEAAFVLTKGQPRLYDISILTRIWERKWKLDKDSKAGKSKHTERGSTRRMEDEFTSNQARALFETFYGDAIIISQTNARNVTFEGLILRQHLREDIRSVIFKYGATPHGEWSMLAQVGNIPERKETYVNDENARLSDSVDEISFEKRNNWLEVVTELIGRSNEFQQQMGTVVFPKISISPIAIYREVPSLH